MVSPSEDPRQLAVFLNIPEHSTCIINPPSFVTCLQGKGGKSAQRSPEHFILKNHESTAKASLPGIPHQILFLLPSPSNSHNPWLNTYIVFILQRIPYLIFILYTKKTETLHNLLKITQLISGPCVIWTLEVWLQNPCSLIFKVQSRRCIPWELVKNEDFQTPPRNSIFILTRSPGDWYLNNVWRALFYITVLFTVIGLPYHPLVLSPCSDHYASFCPRCTQIIFALLWAYCLRHYKPPASAPYSFVLRDTHHAILFYVSFNLFNPLSFYSDLGAL